MTPEQVHKRIKTVNGEKVFNGSLNLSYKNLTSLEPYNLYDVIVTSHFWCDNNYKLTSLKGSPKQVGSSFYCYNNKLTTLEGAPNEVGGNFYCYNNNLTSLEGLPETIGSLIYIEKRVLHRLYLTNPLVSLYAIQDKFYFV